MPTTFEDAPESVAELGADVLRAYHQDLHAAGVTITYLFAFGPRDADGETTGPALKTRGHRALAKVQINKLPDRVQGMADATIKIDGDAWPTLSPDQQRSLLDHEQTHLELTLTGDPPVVKRDDIGRPALKMRHHDSEIGIFHDCIERHQAGSVDLDAVKAVVGKVRELVQTVMWG